MAFVFQVLDRPAKEAFAAVAYRLAVRRKSIVWHLLLVGFRCPTALVQLWRVGLDAPPDAAAADGQTLSAVISPIYATEIEKRRYQRIRMMSPDNVAI